MSIRERQEHRFVQDCREKIQIGTSKVVCSHEDSPVYGFTKIFLLRKAKKLTRITTNAQKNLHKISFSKKVKFFFSLMKIFRTIFRESKSQFKELGQNDRVKEIKLESDAGSAIWNELNDLTSKKWGIKKIGFTKVPDKLVFQNKCILYPHALIFMDEMRKTEIDQAPNLRAGKEAMRIYAHLGEVVNDIARWLREKGIRCQPNHPLGGLTVTPPLAGKAGMGWQGKNGLLITPEFGQRHRLAPIFIEHPVFEYTDSLEHSWIEDYCKTCSLCQNECPVDAILDEKIVNVDNVEGIGQLLTCIDLPKCFPYFRKTSGCSVCIKACPFSEGKGIYYQIKEKFVNSTKSKN